VSNPSPSGSTLTVDIFETKTSASAAAAAAAAVTIRSALAAKGRARIMVGTGNSQLEMIGFLARERDIDWSRVEAFHLDEYVGISKDHPASFRFWIRTRFAEKVRPKVTHYLEGDSKNLDAMLQAYGQDLTSAPVDLAFVGIGENGHIAFNDPHVADFQDPLIVKRVTLDEACRQQQVGEGHFPDIGSMPQEALSVTCTGLFRAERWICCVPDRRKASAVKNSLEGPLTTACPGSLVRRHPSASLYLDMASASLLSPAFVRASCRVHGATEASRLPMR
jgi:glucosamine-6-phosphate deaminase